MGAVYTPRPAMSVTVSGKLTGCRRLGIVALPCMGPRLPRWVSASALKAIAFSDGRTMPIYDWQPGELVDCSRKAATYLYRSVHPTGT